MEFGVFDMLIVVIYLAASVGFGAWIGRKQTNTSDYFLGNRNIPWPAAGFSIVATETSVLTFISIPAVAYQGNFTFIQIVLGFVVGRILVAAVMLPAYYRGKITTAYHFLGQRFGQHLRKITSIVFMATRLLADGVRLFATAIPLAIIMKGTGLFSGISDGGFYALSILIVGILTIIYTYIGGIRSVIWMDVIQMAVYVGGALLAAGLIINNLDGGIKSVVDLAKANDKLQWFNSGFSLSFGEFIKQPYTFFTALFGGAVFSLASHGTDQLIIQRVLTCKDKRASQKAMLLSGVGIFFQFSLFLTLGVLLFAFYHGADFQDLGLTRADGIFPKFIVEEMPSGISGIIVASLFAAAMSTLSSSLSSLSSASVLDIYIPLIKHKKSEGELLRISRMVTLGWGIVLILTGLSFIGLQGTVVEVALGIASYTYGGLLGAFLLGLFNKRVSERNAIIGFTVALVIMMFVIKNVEIAWPLYTVVGSLATIMSGFLLNLFSKKN